ncbi:hypothetical protein [Emticicia sp. BO119]|uniref:hypothetical protein n=1 Tax=Emticicia sp. BO119 TaxID=2757768 RepID=UPI0015F013D1|nr:hypothetical protein [Emticicia sp. BO119]MBA4852387.1 hypothetical protein [Emticicia sp. BO119]
MRLIHTPVMLSYFSQSEHDNYLTHLLDEHTAIGKAWEQCKIHDNHDKYLNVDFPSRPSVKGEDIMNDIKDYKHRIIIFHFSGHAGDKQLFFENGPLYAKGVAGLLAEAQNLKLVFLNGCSTFDQVNLLFENNIKIVIATKGKIADGIAKEFANIFYQALSDRSYTIKSAFEHAINGLIAKQKILSETSIQPIIWRSSLKIQTKDENDRWQLFVKEGEETILDDIYWWKLKNLPISTAKQEGSTVPGLYFIYDKCAINEYKLFKDKLVSKITKKKVTVNGTYTAEEENKYFYKENLDLTDVKIEIKAADILIILIKNNEFITFWDSLKIDKKDIKSKSIIFVSIKDPKDSIEYLKEEGIIPELTIPFGDWKSSFTEIAGISDDIKKIMFGQMYKEFIEEPSNKVSQIIRNFNFKTQKEYLELALQNDKRLIFTYIEGTKYCGQNILVKSYKEILRRRNIVAQEIKLSLKHYQIQTYEDIIKYLAEELKFEGEFYSNFFKLNNSYNLLILFEDLFIESTGRSKAEIHAKAIFQFAEELEKKTLASQGNKIFIIAINNAYDNVSLFEKLNTNNSLFFLRNDPIKQVEKEEIILWAETTTTPEDVNVNRIDLDLPNYITPVVQAICKQLNIPPLNLKQLFD